VVAAGDEITALDITTLEDYTIRKPVGFMQQAVGQSVPDATLTAITFTTETFDSHGYHDTAVNNSRVTPTLAGYYRFAGAYWSLAQTTPVNLDASIRQNGSSTTPGGIRQLGAATTNSMWAETILAMNGTTDYVELMGFQDSAGAVTSAVSARFTSFFCWEFIRPL
jgi:hypothetical protein